MAGLRTAEQIRAAGAAAVAGWRLTPAQVEEVVSILMPVRGETAAPVTITAGRERAA
jgi:biotin synthase-like enzyme